MSIRRNYKFGYWKSFARITAASLATLSVAFFVWTQPAIAAFVCPGCFGFERLSGNVFIDSAMSIDQRAKLVETLAIGEERVGRFYGVLRENPIMLACTTEICSQRLAGKGAKAVSYASFGMRLSPLRLDPVIVAHERAHIELHGRLGLVRFLSGAVPAWFDEGLAVVISDDPRYLLPADANDRCRIEPGDALPTNMGEWMRRASIDPDLYARAACRVSRWMNARGGRDGLLALVNRISVGEAFDAAYNGP